MTICDTASNEHNSVEPLNFGFLLLALLPLFVVIVIVIMKFSSILAIASVLQLGAAFAPAPLSRQSTPLSMIGGSLATFFNLSYFNKSHVLRHLSVPLNRSISTSRCDSSCRCSSCCIHGMQSRGMRHGRRGQGFYRVACKRWLGSRSRW